MARMQRDGGLLHLVLDATEVDVLASLAEGLADRVTAAMQGGLSDPVIERLTPTATRGDADLDAELRELLRGDLLSSRSQRLTVFADALRRAQSSDTGVSDHALNRDAAMRTIEVLNDLRLALAATIGFEDDLRQQLAADDPRRDAVQLMDALAWLQGGLIEFVDEDD